MDKIAYLRGLLDGQGVDPATKEGKAQYAVCEALEDIMKYIQKLEDRVEELEEQCDILDEAVADVEDMLMDEDDDDDAYDCEGCPEDCETVCPNCGEELEFDVDESELQALAPDAEE